jgi:hypothetical protein
MDISFGGRDREIEIERERDSCTGTRWSMSLSMPSRERGIGSTAGWGSGHSGRWWEDLRIGLKKG